MTDINLEPAFDISRPQDDGSYYLLLLAALLILLVVLLMGSILSRATTRRQLWRQYSAGGKSLCWHQCQMGNAIIAQCQVLTRCLSAKKWKRTALYTLPARSDRGAVQPRCWIHVRWISLRLKIFFLGGFMAFRVNPAAFWCVRVCVCVFSLLIEWMLICTLGLLKTFYILSEWGVFIIMVNGGQEWGLQLIIFSLLTHCVITF